MGTVQFLNHDSRLNLFTDGQTFIVTTEPQHLGTDAEVPFNDVIIKPGTVFSSLGKNALHQGLRFIEATDGHYYQFKGVIDEVSLPRYKGPVSLFLFTAFSVDGPHKGLVDFAKTNKAGKAYYALAINPINKTLEFVDAELKHHSYTSDINIMNDNGSFLLVDDL
ncbi:MULTISPECIES: hypothetical protein [Pseudoalteromonas]|uniref:hypothetical protein n=1 Tax=Pseudoalteromonas TaxID=53246 RepID=UPI00158185B7|nr:MULTISPECIES: hypothetical protein [Pseudoalteromonas]MDI4652623.1 hypothetical protein [Pseudoalteromonas shioyasakiensis]NUJ38667.1 hypothetical protein [Pseudoalteromonas sp. 0303]